MLIGEIVRALRIKHGMTQKELSVVSGIKQPNISRLEAGIIDQPSIDFLNRLAKSLGTTIDYLIGNTKILSFNDTLLSDEQAQKIFRCYEALSVQKKKELCEFSCFLMQQQETT